MIFCPYCGAANEEGSITCYECEQPLPQQDDTKRAKLSIPKPIWTIGGLVLVMALIVSGVIWAVFGSGNAVSAAATKTMGEMVKDEEENIQLQQFYTVTDERLTEGEFTLYASFSGGSFDVQIDVDYSRPDKQLCGNLSYNDFELEYSANNEVAQFRFPGEYEVYGFKIRDTKKVTQKVNSMSLIPFAGDVPAITVPEDFTSGLFKKTTLKALLQAVAGEEYEAFQDSVAIKKWNDETIARAGHTEDCTVYKVSWKSEALTDLLGAVGSGGILPNIAGLVNMLMPEMDPYMYCYLNEDGYLVAVQFTVAGTKCFLLFDGEENLWDHITLTADTLSGQVLVYEGAMERSGNDMHIYLKDSNGQEMITILYNDQSGVFSLSTASAGTVLDGNVYCRVGEASIRLNWELPDVGKQSISCTITRLQKEPEQLGEHYADLKKMEWSVIENLINDWLNR